jgi:hypothetical protein
MKKRVHTDLIVIHCSATRPDMDIGRKEIDDWHKARGWNGIGYHDVIRRDGTQEEGRPYDVVGAHVQDLNSHSVGICMVGGVAAGGTPEDNFTEAQYKTLKGILGFYRALYPDAQIRGHNAFAKKACPSFDWKAWLKKEGIDAK